MLTDIPTALSPIEAHALTMLAEDKAVLELGSLLGFSTITMARVAERVLSIDPHEGYPAENPRPTWGKFNENLLAYEVADIVTAIKGDDSELWSAQVGDEAPFGFAFIDITGEYPDTFRALERVMPLMLVDALVAVHDYDLPEWPGAGEAVRDFCAQTGARFGIIDTLAIIRPAHPDD